jgi:tripartite-type tricarboxylate transporter receptor subunit TctC
MLVAPAQTPRHIVDRLHGEIVEFLATQEAKDQVAKSGFVPVEGRSVESLQDFVKSEIARWGKVVRDAGFAGSQ